MQTMEVVLRTAQSVFEGYWVIITENFREDLETMLAQGTLPY